MQMWELEDHPVQFEGCVCAAQKKRRAGQFLAGEMLETLGIWHNSRAATAPI